MWLPAAQLVQTGCVLMLAVGAAAGWTEADQQAATCEPPTVTAQVLGASAVRLNVGSGGCAVRLYASSAAPGARVMPACAAEPTTLTAEPVGLCDLPAGSTTLDVRVLSAAGKMMWIVEPTSAP